MSIASLGAQTDIVSGTKPTTAFLRFLQALQNASNGGSGDVSQLQDDIRQIAQDLGSPDGSVSNIPPQSSGNPTLKVDVPLTFAGLLQNGFMEIGWGGTTDDVPEGKKNHYYNITRAWFFG